MSETSSATSAPSVWRSRDFRLVMVGGTVNDIGDWMLSLALPVYVFTETNSGFDAAMLLMLELVVGVAFGPLAGSLVDRWNLRRTIICTNLLQAVTLLPLLAANHDRIWIVYVVGAAQAFLIAVNNPASWALVPRVVTEDQLVQAGASFSAGGSIARLVGAPLGGILIDQGGLETVVIADTATFLFVAAAVVFLRAPTAPIPKSADETEADNSGVEAGWRVIRTKPVLVGYLIAQSLANVAFAMFTLIFIKFVFTELHGDESDIGIIRGMAAFGGLVASLVITRAAKRANPAYLMLWGYLTFSLVGWTFINMTFVTTAMGLYLFMFALTGFPNATSQIGANATAQRWCPPEIRGRLAGVLSATTAVGAGIGTLAVGLLIDHVNVVLLFNTQTLMFFFAFLVTLFLIVRRLPAEPATPARAVETAESSL